jgi:coenzyme F420-reducing hydrogenase gamma subunit
MKILNGDNKLSVAVHKFSSCDGCQLAFLNAGPDLLTLADLVDIKHFIEAGPVNHDAEVDIAFVEGCISTNAEVERIQHVRAKSRYLITIGACATSGGVQALRNLNQSQDWVSSVYASPEYIDSLAHVAAVAQHVRVDFEVWGCPPNSRQIVTVIRSLLNNATPLDFNEKVCMECKRLGNVCTLVARGKPCMGPVTRTGCGALCPSFERDCYTCYGPSENPNTASLANRLHGLGLMSEAVAQRFHHVANSAPPFAEAGLKAREKK